MVILINTIKCLSNQIHVRHRQTNGSKRISDLLDIPKIVFHGLILIFRESEKGVLKIHGLC